MRRTNEGRRALVIMDEAITMPPDLMNFQRLEPSSDCMFVRVFQSFYRSKIEPSDLSGRNWHLWRSCAAAYRVRAVGAADGSTEPGWRNPAALLFYGCSPFQLCRLIAVACLTIFSPLVPTL
jgi:hypothetical protein